MSIPLQELDTNSEYLIQPNDLRVEDFDDLLALDYSRDTYEEETTIQSTILDAAFNFTNSIVGAGIIGLPYALKQAGSITGILLLVFLTYLVDQTVILLVQDGKLAGQTTYQGLTQYCFGKKGFLAISLFQFIFAYGAMCAYTVILGDTIPKLFQQILPQSSILSSRSFAIVFCTLAVSLPLSLNRDISALAKTSAISLGMIVLMVGAVLFQSGSLPKDMMGDPGLRWTFIGDGLFQAIGVISFAFVCHHNTFLIMGSLKKPTLDRFAIVTHISTLILFGMNMFLTFPMECFVCREVLFQYLWSHLYHPSVDLTKEASEFAHVTATLALVLSAMFIALSTCDLGFVLELTGGFAATVLAFILPALCYLKLAQGDIFSRKKLTSVFMICFGVIVMILSTITSISNFLSGEKSKKC